MSRRHQTRRTMRLRLIDLLLLAPTATAISLSNFQFITSNGIPLGCIVAYNTPLSGCTETDFTQGNPCSARCVRGVERITENLAGACESVDATPNSLLDLAVSGTLMDVLCPNNRDGDEPATTTARVTTTISSSRGFTTIPTTASTATDDDGEEDDERSTTSTAESETSSFVDPTAADPAQDTNVQPQPTAGNGGNGDGVAVQPTAEADAPVETELVAGGGGSPFDPIQIVSGGASWRSISTTLVWTIGAVVAGVVL